MVLLLKVCVSSGEQPIRVDYLPQRLGLSENGVPVLSGIRVFRHLLVVKSPFFGCPKIPNNNPWASSKFGHSMQPACSNFTLFRSSSDLGPIQMILEDSVDVDIWGWMIGRYTDKNQLLFGMDLGNCM